jgi:hypothetical protein
VEASDHVDEARFPVVIHSIRESTEEGSPKSHGNLGKGPRQFRDQGDDLLECLDELVAEAWSLGIVPLPG